MTPEEAKKLVKGAVVTVRARINLSKDADGDVRLMLLAAGGDTCAAWCAPSEILSVEPRAIAAGDRFSHGDSAFVVVHVDEDQAWCRHEKGKRLRFTILVSSLQQIDRLPRASAPAAELLRHNATDNARNGITLDPRYNEDDSK